jgi:hypothetical protein
MTRFETKSRIGSDGVLNVTVPLGIAEANREVRVIIEPVDRPERAPSMGREEWKQFVMETAGSISDPTFRRHEQEEFESARSVR